MFGMKSAKMPIRKTAAGRYYFSIPPRLSPTGKRRREFFEIREDATAARQAIMDSARKHGPRAVGLTPSQAEDASKAIDTLRKYGKSLAEAANHLVEHLERQAKSISFRDLWVMHQTRKESEKVSEFYLRDLRVIGDKIDDAIGGKLVSDLADNPGELEKAIEANFKTTTRFNFACRNLRPAFQLAVNRGYASANPFDRIERRKAAKTTEPEFLTVPQARAMLAEAERNYPACRAAVALLLFAGIRPRELTRLTWESIDFDGGFVRIGAGTAKTRDLRFVEISGNLAEWLKTTPKTERAGAIVSSNWAKDIQAIRRAAGIEGQDLPRHSFASYHAAVTGDLRRTMENMGHSTSAMTLKHYKGLASKRDAINYFSIVPKGKATPSIREAS